MKNSSPILFLIFNRPVPTAKVFEKIRQACPPKLFIAADGPREGHDEDKVCNDVRSIITQIDWPCEVHTLFREANLGCGKAVSEAISWFFENVEKGIILEDDCLPNSSFFEFCDELLDKYADTKEVMAISGTNLLPSGWKPKQYSYFFAYGGIWGWASWRRAWKLYNYDMPDWEYTSNKDKIKKAMKNKNWFIYFFGLFEGTYLKEIDTWDVQWTYCIFNNGGLSINPAVNLVTNIGFGPNATHTGSSNSPYAQMLSKKIAFPLKHPNKIEMNKRYLRASFKYIFEFNKSHWVALKSWGRLHLNKIKKKNVL